MTEEFLLGRGSLVGIPMFCSQTTIEGCCLLLLSKITLTKKKFHTKNPAEFSDFVLTSNWNQCVSEVFLLKLYLLLSWKVICFVLVDFRYLLVHFIIVQQEPPSSVSYEFCSFTLQLKSPYECQWWERWRHSRASIV